jgi:hypothetical protein
MVHDPVRAIGVAKVAVALPGFPLSLICKLQSVIAAS